MRTRRRYVLIQLILVGLCFVSLLFSMFRENVVIRQVIQRYELPYLGTTLLRTIDGKPVQGLAHEIRTFEDSNRVLVYILTDTGRFLYPDTVTDDVSKRISLARLRILDEGRSILHDPAGVKTPVLWGMRDNRTGNLVFLSFSRLRITDLYRQESHRLTMVFFILFFLLATGIFLIVRKVFHSLNKEAVRDRGRYERLQAVIEAQLLLINDAVSLMERCGVALKNRDPSDPVAEDLCDRGLCLGKNREIFSAILGQEGNSFNSEVVCLHDVCSRVQGLVADEFAETGVALVLVERDAGLQVRGQETLLVMALEGLLRKLLLLVSGGSRIVMTIRGSGERVLLDFAVPLTERSVFPAVFFVSGCLFELLGIRLGYETDEHMELIIHAEFQGAGV